MGFRSRARARRAGQVNILKSNKDVSTNVRVSADVLSPTEEVADDVTILGVVKPTNETPVVVPPTVEDVPQGTTNELKAWVGESVDRARVAYEKEKSAEKPRKVLMSHLEGMLNE